MNKQSIIFFTTVTLTVALIVFMGTKLIGLHNFYLLSPSAEGLIIVSFILASLYFNITATPETSESK